MNRTATSFTIVCGLLGLWLQIAPVQAALITYVSSTGSNAGNCTRLAPCQTLNFALGATDPGGEIRVLDPGGYGAMTITKSVNIVGEGPDEAALLVGGGKTAITINAGANDVVSIRGITIKGVGNGAGIVFNTGRTLIVADCTIYNLTGTGIAFHATTSSNLVVSNTLINKVGARGIHVNPPVGSNVAIRAVVHRTQVYNSTGLGIFAQGTGASGTIDMTVSESVSSSHPQDGIRANSLLGATTILSVVRSVSSNNGVGISAANAFATVRVAGSMVTGNTSGWLAESSGTLQSYGDNYVDGNTGSQGAMPLASRK